MLANRLKGWPVGYSKTQPIRTRQSEYCFNVPASPSVVPVIFRKRAAFQGHLVEQTKSGVGVAVYV